MIKEKILYILILSLLLLSCSKDDARNNNCHLTRVEYQDSSIHFEFEYNNNKLSKIKDFYWSSSLPEGITFNVNYITNDSIIIQRASEFSYPIISAKYNGNKLSELRENIGGNYLYKFTYSSDKIRVLQVYINLNGAGGITYENVAYADYFFDTNKNIKKIKEYKYNPINSENATLNIESDYTYDNANNPLNGNIYLNFYVLYDQLPHPSFFNKNNILSRNEKNTGPLYYDYEYDDNNNTIKGGLYPSRDEFYSFECF
ncbi:hypothetical protein [Yeosuana sp. AK3]